MIAFHPHLLGAISSLLQAFIGYQSYEPKEHKRLIYGQETPSPVQV